jgi:hypothetical protein
MRLPWDPPKNDYFDAHVRVHCQNVYEQIMNVKREMESNTTTATASNQTTNRYTKLQYIFTISGITKIVCKNKTRLLHFSSEGLMIPFKSLHRLYFNKY